MLSQLAVYDPWGLRFPETWPVCGTPPPALGTQATSSPSSSSRVLAALSRLGGPSVHAARVPPLPARPQPQPLSVATSPVLQVYAEGRPSRGGLLVTCGCHPISLLVPGAWPTAGDGGSRAGTCCVPAFATHSEQTPRGPFNPGCSPRGQGAGPGSRGWWRRLWTPWVPVALTAARCDRICRAGWTLLTSTALSWCPSEPESSTCRRTSPPSWPGRWGGCPRR